MPTDRDQARRFNDDLPWGSRGGTAFHYYFPVDGEYGFQLRLKQSGAAGGFEGVTAERHEVDVSLDGARVWTTTLGGPEFTKLRGEARDKKILEALRDLVAQLDLLHSCLGGSLLDLFLCVYNLCVSLKADRTGE